MCPRTVPMVEGRLKEKTETMKRTKQSGHITTECQSTASQAQFEGLGLIELHVFPWNMNQLWVEKRN